MASKGMHMWALPFGLSSTSAVTRSYKLGSALCWKAVCQHVMRMSNPLCRSLAVSTTSRDCRTCLYSAKRQDVVLKFCQRWTCIIWPAKRLWLLFLTSVRRASSNLFEGFCYNSWYVQVLHHIRPACADPAAERTPALRATELCSWGFVQIPFSNTIEPNLLKPNTGAKMEILLAKLELAEAKGNMWWKKQSLCSSGFGHLPTHDGTNRPFTLLTCLADHLPSPDLSEGAKDAILHSDSRYDKRTMSAKDLQSSTVKLVLVARVFWKLATAEHRGNPRGSVIHPTARDANAIVVFVHVRHMMRFASSLFEWFHASVDPWLVELNKCH